MSVAEPKLYGCASMTAPLRRVLLRPPRSDDLRFWSDYGWRAKPDPPAIAREHEALCGLLADAGTEVVLAERPVEGDPDAIYVYDPALIADTGAVLLRPGKAGRRGEPDALGADLQQAGVPIAGRLEGSSLGEGGDLIRLDEATLLAGLGYRTNQAGVEALGLVTGLDLVGFDLPHWHGESEVMHLLSLLSPLADDLVVAYKPLLPVRLAQLLTERGIEIVPVPDEEFESMGANVVAFSPQVAVVVGGNPKTRRRLHSSDTTVLAYEGKELSKGDGGPTCLTCPILRD